MKLAMVALILATGGQGPGVQETGVQETGGQATGGTLPAPPAVPAATAPGAPSVDQRLAEAASLGRLIHALDRAAWVSSDALTHAVPREQLAGAGGYVVEAIDGQVLRVTYYRGSGADARAFFVADVRGGKVVRRDMLAAPVALTADQAILARARDVAAARARERAYTPCTPAPFNTVVVPSRKRAPIAVYLLSAQQEAGAYPLGGQYRVIVAPDGGVLASRPYSVGCRDLTVPKLPPGAKPAGFAVNHLLDPVPTEIHVLTSYNLRMPLFVATPDKRVWHVQGSSITAATAR